MCGRNTPEKSKKETWNFPGKRTSLIQILAPFYTLISRILIYSPLCDKPPSQETGCQLHQKTLLSALLGDLSG